MVNDMEALHGLDADSINSWVDGTHVNGGPEGDNIIPLVTNPDTSRPVSGPDMTNMTETVSASVDPCITPLGTTMLVAGCDHNISIKNQPKKSTSTLTEKSTEKSTSAFPAVSNMVTGWRRAVTAVSGRFTVPRTSGLNVRSCTATNTPSSHVAHERGCTPHITRDDPHVTTVLDIPLPPTPTQPPPPPPHHHHTTPSHHQTTTTSYHHRHYHHRVFVRRPGFRSKFRRTERMRI
jgi:hypothetical protein